MSRVGVLFVCLIMNQNCIVRGKGQSAKVNNMSTGSVSARLAVEVRKSEALARLQFTNHYKEAVYLEKVKGCLDGVIENNVFRITTEGQKVRYIGKMVKRSAPGPDDFRKLEPEKSTEVLCHLETSYDFLPGTHDYAIHYEAYHSLPDGSDIWHLESNEVKFQLTR